MAFSQEILVEQRLQGNRTLVMGTVSLASVTTGELSFEGYTTCECIVVGLNEGSAAAGDFISVDETLPLTRGSSDTAVAVTIDGDSGAKGTFMAILL